MVFRKKTIIPNLTIGQRLKRARQRQKISLEQAQNQTLIRAKYIKALENNNWLDLPGRVYLQGYLRRYSDFLGLDGKKVVGQFNSEFSQWAKPNPSAPKTAKSLKSQFTITPKLIGLTLVVVGVMAMMGAIGWQVHQVGSPPTLVIVAPGEEVVWDKEQLEIIGRTSPGSVVFINTQNVIQDDQGNFRQVVELQDGLNTIEIVAKSRFNRETAKVIKVLKTAQAGER